MRSFFILKFGLKGTPLAINRPQMRPQNGGYVNNDIEKCKEDFPFRVISETPTGDGFVDCVWEMPEWVVEKLEAEAKKREITVSDLVTLILKAALKEKKNEK